MLNNIRQDWINSVTLTGFGRYTVTVRPQLGSDYSVRLSHAELSSYCLFRNACKTQAGRVFDSIIGDEGSESWQRYVSVLFGGRDVVIIDCVFRRRGDGANQDRQSDPKGVVIDGAVTCRGEAHIQRRGDPRAAARVRRSVGARRAEHLVCDAPRTIEPTAPVRGSRG